MLETGKKGRTAHGCPVLRPTPLGVMAAQHCGEASPSDPIEGKQESESKAHREAESLLPFSSSLATF